MNFAQYRGRILISVGFAVLVLIGLLLYGDLPRTIEAMRGFEMQLLPAILALTLVNYLLRFGKWHFYIRQLGATQVSAFDSLLIFFCGLSMTVTPGKVGEWLKCYLLQRVSGVTFSRSAPVVLAERITDGLSLVVLATGGILVFGLGWEVFLGAVLFAAVTIGVSQYRPFALWLLAQGERAPILRPQMRHVRSFYEGSAVLFSGRNLLIAVGIGVVSWFGECLALFLVLVALGIEPNAMVLLQSTFILAIATLAGALFLTPGGLGAAEGALAGLLRLLVGASASVGAAATIIIRACTLWFGVALGAIALVYFLQTRLKSVDLAPDTVGASPAPPTP